MRRNCCGVTPHSLRNPLKDGRLAAVAVQRADHSVFMEQKQAGQQNWERGIFCFFAGRPQGKTTSHSKMSKRNQNHVRVVTSLSVQGFPDQRSTENFEKSYIRKGLMHETIAEK